MSTAPPIADPAVTPSNASEAPNAAEDNDAAVSTGRGTKTIPAGDNDSESSMTPNARGSPGPGTNVADEVMLSTRPRRSGRGGISTVTLVHSVAVGVVPTAKAAARKVRSGLFTAPP